MICNSCGNKISDDSKFCYKCGNKVINDFLFCSNCGNKASANELFCCKCGYKLDNSNSVDINNNISLTTTKSDNVSTNTTESSSIEYDIQKGSNLELESIPKQSIEEQNNYSQNIELELEKEKNKNKTYTKVIIFCGIIVFLIMVLAIADNSNDATSNKNYNTNNATSNKNHNTNNTITNNNELALTKTFTDKKDDIAFNYPTNWSKIDISIEGYDMIVGLIAPVDQSFAANMLLYKIDVNIDPKYFNSQDLVAQLYSQQGMDVQEIIETKVDGIDALKIISLVINECTSIQYVYNYNNALYIITFTSATKSLDKYEPIFDSIMESYTITR